MPEPEPGRRRTLRAALGAAAAAAALPGCNRRPFWLPPPVLVHAPGRDAGHRLRERWRAGPPRPSDWRDADAERVDVAIVGSGVAGLACAWRLARAGHRDHVVLVGPEWLGNAAGLRLSGIDCPGGSHYLPLPSVESTHLRELLADAGVLLGDPSAPAPEYDERALVHAPSHRVMSGGRWWPGPLPPAADRGAEDQAARFLARADALSHERGPDGRRAFVVPIEAASRDAPSRVLDTRTASAWLDAEGWTDPGLRWYLEYCARDEFGASLDEISAWALVHYFAARAGRARNAEPGAVLTWPDGLAPLATHLAGPAVAAGRLRPVSVERIETEGRGVRLFGWRDDPADASAAPRPVVVRARVAVVATPRPVAARLVPELAADAAAGGPGHAPWTVANVVFRRPPEERRTGGEDELAWDNVVHGSTALGYVHALHQAIRIDTTGPTVLTAYRAYPRADRDARAELARLLGAGDAARTEDWLALVGTDLVAAYGPRIWREVARVHVTVRGHGMSAPAPGFLSDPGTAAMRAADGPVRFAHSDLSGYSVFEEAAWWGVRAAERIAGG